LGNNYLFIFSACHFEQRQAEKSADFVFEFFSGHSIF